MGHQPLSKQTVLDAEKHLSHSCNVMARLIAVHGPCLLADREFRPFQTLATSIISQQLSAKAADMIERRVQAIVPSFCPAGFRAVPTEALCAAGLSSAKARYIVELARRVSDGRLSFEAMQQAPDDDVIAALIELPGIGPWTAEMFLIFGLRRPDCTFVRGCWIATCRPALVWRGCRIGTCRPVMAALLFGSLMVFVAALGRLTPPSR